MYFMGLNLSTSQIELGLFLNKDDTQDMVEMLRKNIVDKNTGSVISQVVECNEVYILA